MRRFRRWAAVGVLAVGVVAAGVVAAGVAHSRPTGETRSLVRTSDTPRPEAAVSLVWSNPAEVRVNRPAPYTLTVTNTGSQPVQAVVVQVRVPAGVTAADADPPAKAVGGVLLWELGTLDVAEARPLKLTLTSPTRGPLTAEAWVTLTGSAATTATVREPKLEAFVDAPESVEIGQVFTVVYRAANAGDSPIDGRLIELVHTPANEPTVESFVADQNGYVALRPGDNRAVMASEKAAAPGVRVYELTVTGPDGLKATASAKVKVLAPKLTVTVTGPAELGVGRTGQYRVKVTNTGDLTAEDVNLSLDAGAGLKAHFGVHVLAGLATDPLAGAGLRGFGLRPGQSREFVQEADATTPGGAVFTASATERRGIKAAAECRTTVKGVPGIRMELTDAVDPLKVGEETTYEIKVTNTGTAADRNLVLVCDLPTGLALVKAAGPVPSLERVGVDFEAPNAIRNVHTVTFEPVRDLGPKTEVVFKVTVKAEKPGTAKFKAGITSDHLTTAVTKEESTTVYGE